ncbi:ATP-dependent sacrificial sulfur transferase LarE [Stieleria varia]|uniref:tRNA-specific 2-thiouridylase MnmA n=1 Tax=Stieleria varia TaxID=2528005 RepID=A0A5C6ATU7_9BACT|nr:ATP-dependent sacrificial sulfur transferase LarE [Stieleria varia]TWU02442.1 tRNA-specific 2-thiouridylase MnmA [Stieleria varia]
MNDPAQNANRLMDALAGHRRLVVAFSGGVDSSVVVAAAARCHASGTRLQSVIAVTARSPSVPRWQLDLAIRVAKEIGVEHRIVDTQETLRPEYVTNDSQRCFYCKQTLYATLTTIAAQHGSPTAEDTVALVSGTNADDLGDYRPGIQAGRQADVLTPLADLGLGKAEVRQLAKYFGLSNAELPASPCLASRIAYGVSVTPERLGMVEKAESILRDLGFSDLRVRLHENDLARIEVPVEEMQKLLQSGVRRQIDVCFRELGFLYVTIDLCGLHSGSMNLPLVSISGAAD